MNDIPTSDTDGFKEPLLPYYVYVLLNPLKSNKAFYVGKGTGQRAGAHERDVHRLLEDEKRKRNQQVEQEKNSLDEDPLDLASFDEKILSDKQREIFELKKANASPLQVIVGRYETEEEAYAVEAALIHFMFGYENLTNLASGHGHKFLRTKNEYEEIVANAKEQIDILPRKGVDKERVVRDNAYRDEKLVGLEQARAFDKLAELQNSLTKHGFNWRNFTEPGDKYFHPGVSNGYLALIVRIGAVDFNVQFTKKKIFSIQFIYTPTRPKSFEEAQSLALARLPQIQRDRLGIALGDPKADNKYSWILPEARFKFESIDALIAELVRFKSVIDSDSSNS
jgi:hypothetical protein